MKRRQIVSRTGEGQRALITGASGGIGLELARRFARDGYDLILVARSEARLADIAASLREEFRIAALAVPSDLGRIGAGAELAAKIDARGLAVDVLVNNAGYGMTGALADSAIDDLLAMLDLDIRALTELTRLLWPRLLKRGRGGVLNVASTAAFQPIAGMAAYAAAKAFVRSFSEALWEEARGSGVKVCCLCPGPTRTGFAKRAAAENSPIFKYGTMSPQRVADFGYRAFRRGRRIAIPGFANRFGAAVVPFSPRGMILKVGRWLVTGA